MLLTGLQVKLHEGILALFCSPFVLRSSEDDVQVGYFEGGRTKRRRDHVGRSCDRCQQSQENCGR